MRSEPPAKAQALAAQVERDGGTTLALYQEPLGDHWQIFCLLPRERVEASPYQRDRKSTRLNSSHTVISYAVFCLKKKKNWFSSRRSAGANTCSGCSHRQPAN